MEKIEKWRILEEATEKDPPPRDEHAIYACLKKLRIPLPIVVEFQYGPGDDVNTRWKGLRSEIVVIPFEDYKRQLYWWPWIRRFLVPAEFSAIVTIGDVVSPTNAISQLSEPQAIIRWRAWEQGKAHTDGFLEIYQEPDPLQKHKWRERVSIQTFNRRLKIEPLQLFLDTLRTQGKPGVKDFYTIEEFSYKVEEKFLFLQSQLGRTPTQVELAKEMGIVSKTLQNYFGKRGSENWEQFRSRLRI